LVTIAFVCRSESLRGVSVRVSADSRDNLVAYIVELQHQLKIIAIAEDAVTHGA
jgi:hypothetical protein